MVWEDQLRKSLRRQRVSAHHEAARPQARGQLRLSEWCPHMESARVFTVRAALYIAARVRVKVRREAVGILVATALHAIGMGAEVGSLSR
eukprot:14822592-Alexandrium_andersonii.AAC.1